MKPVRIKLEARPITRVSVNEEPLLRDYWCFGNARHSLEF